MPSLVKIVIESAQDLPIMDRNAQSTNSLLTLCFICYSITEDYNINMISIFLLFIYLKVVMLQRMLM